MSSSPRDVHPSSLVHGPETSHSPVDSRGPERSLPCQRDPTPFENWGGRVDPDTTPVVQRPSPGFPTLPRTRGTSLDPGPLPYLRP